MLRRRILFRLTVAVVLLGGAFLIVRRILLSAFAGSEPIAIDAQPAHATYERAFPNLEFERPVGLMFPPDGTNRIAVITQFGSVFIFPNDPSVTAASEALDIHKLVVKDGTNEEGLLGLAFHPRFRENRQFFLYYTKRDHINVVARFTMSANEANRADAASEEEILRLPAGTGNHNGGTIVFGPDGCLYIAVGDGGPVGDPNGNAQNTATMLGKILRIDVDHTEPGLNYAIPKDNPFVNRPGACREIWALGLRNVWRMAFDRRTDRLWAADVGEDTWEEIDVIQRGGNYGWNIKEGFRKFSMKGVSPATARAGEELIDPVFAYNHTVGNCIVGGCVYRGTKIPELVGAYLFADYVTGQVYALSYDENSGQAVSVRRIGPAAMPVFSFGEDEAGDVYFTTAQGIINRVTAP